MIAGARFLLGLGLGITAAVGFEACICGDPPPVDRVALGTYSLAATSPASPALRSGALVVKEDAVVLDYAMADDRTGRVTWSVTNKSVGEDFAEGETGIGDGGQCYLDGMGDGADEFPDDACRCWPLIQDASFEDEAQCLAEVHAFFFDVWSIESACALPILQAQDPVRYGCYASAAPKAAACMDATGQCCDSTAAEYNECFWEATRKCGLWPSETAQMVYDQCP